MAISESTLSRWSHHQAATAFTQAHLPIRAALDAYKWPSEIKYEVFLQGSYKNDTNLGGDSDVDVVVRLNQRLRPRVAELSGRLLQEDASHQGAYRRWKSFRDHALKAMRARFGNAAESGRKTLKTIIAGVRLLFLPVDLLLKTLLSCPGPIAGDVELQDGRVVDDPVNGSCSGHRVGEDLLPL